MLTPNGGEFLRLWSALSGDGDGAGAALQSRASEPPSGTEGAVSLARRLLLHSSVAAGGGPAAGNASTSGVDACAGGGTGLLRAWPPAVAVLRKGAADAIAAVQASPAAGAGGAAVEELALAVGGDGDASSAGSPRRCGGQGDVLAGVLGTLLAWAARAPPLSADGAALPPPLPGALLACATSAARVTRAAASAAFAAHGRATTTPEIIAALGRAFQAVHPD